MPKLFDAYCMVKATTPACPPQCVTLNLFQCLQINHMKENHKMLKLVQHDDTGKRVYFTSIKYSTIQTPLKYTVKSTLPVRGNV